LADLIVIVRAEASETLRAFGARWRQKSKLFDKGSQIPSW
jgi:hypothetical protein